MLGSNCLFVCQKTSIKVFLEYLNYTIVFLSNFAIKLPKHNNINDYAIKLIEIK